MTTWDPAVERLLDHMLKIDASDLYLTAGSPPVFRVEGAGHPGRTPLDPETVERMADSLMTPAQREQFRAELDLNLALERGEHGRYRVNVHRQRGATGMVVRRVRTRIATLDELGRPEVLKHVANSPRGLVLVVGGAGSGKSTTLAAMLDHRNESGTGHIVTVEDPIEFVHAHKKCVVTQREVGIDARSYNAALRNLLRQTPDLALIGEIRDRDTMETALSIAEAGHVCMATLHATTANQAIERVLHFFPADRQRELLLLLAQNLRAVVAQRLLPAARGGRACAIEVMLDTPRVRDLIKRGALDELKDAMVQGAAEGCRTIDASLAELVAQGKVGLDDALRAADSANDLRLRLRLDLARGGAAASAGDEAPLRLAPVGGHGGR